jgi:hypothetical protein
LPSMLSRDLMPSFDDGQPLAQISWRNWEFQPLYVFQPAILRCFTFQGDVRVQDFLYKRSPYSTS